MQQDKKNSFNKNPPIEKRYKMTTCRYKRSIVRGLHTFSKQYEFIKSNDLEVDLNEKPITFTYTDEKYNFNYLFERENETKSEKKKRLEKEEKKIIFSKSEADIDIKSTNLILDAIENLISINRKQHIKDELKKAIRQREFNGINLFLINEIASINKINEIVCNESFAKKIFTQIKNRVIFRRTGVYNTKANGSLVKQRKKIVLQPTSHNELFIKEIQYIIDNLWLLDFETIENAKEKLKEMEKEEAHPEFDSQYLDDKNSTFFHPIDEEEYNDETFSKKHRQSTMMNPLYYKEVDKIYQDDVWDNFSKIVEDYDDLVGELKDSIDKNMNEIFKYGQLAQKLISIFIEYPNLEEVLKRFKKELKDAKIDLKKKDIFANYCYEYKDIKDIENILWNNEIIIYLQDKLDTLRLYGFVFSYKEKDKVHSLQNKLINQLNIKEYFGVPYVEWGDFENIMYTYFHDEDEMLQAIRFNIRDTSYAKKENQVLGHDELMPEQQSWADFADEYYNIPQSQDTK